MEELEKQSLRATSNIRKLYNECGSLPVSTLFNIFDKTVVPILCYGSEVSGYQKHEILERVHIKFCKWILGVSKKASNMAVLSECGRYPLYIEYISRCVTFWLKIANRDEDWIVKRYLDMSIKLDQVGRHTWSTNVRLILSKYGFYDIWLSAGQNVNTHAFINVFKQRLMDSHVQDWHYVIANSNELKLYIQLKSTYEGSTYLTVLRQKYLIRSMAKFVCSNHALAIETGRYQQQPLPVEDRICLYCYNSRQITVIEDEFYLLIICSVYDVIQNDLL